MVPGRDMGAILEPVVAEGILEPAKTRVEVGSSLKFGRMSLFSTSRAELVKQRCMGVRDAARSLFISGLSLEERRNRAAKQLLRCVVQGWLL